MLFSPVQKSAVADRRSCEFELAGGDETGRVNGDPLRMSTKPSLDALRIDRSSVVVRPGGARWIWVMVIVGALGAGGLWWMKRPSLPEAETALVQAAATGSNRGTLLNASGYVTARRSATVSSKVTGKVVEVMVDEGMQVSEGQVLARLDASNVQAALRLAEAQLEATRQALAETQSNRALAEKELERMVRLSKSGASSQSDLDRADFSVRSLSGRLGKLTADIAVAEAEVAQWQQQLTDTTIVAPFSGIVTSKNAQPGEMISPMSVGGFTRTGICTIVDMSSLEIEVDVNESHINRVRSGQPVIASLDSYPDWKIPAQVIAIIPTADRQKATVKVRVGFDSLDPRILPEMAVKVAFQGESASPVTTASVTIPRQAVFDDDGTSIVWVVRGERVERRAVTVSLTEGETSTIAAGLSPGETIALTTTAPLHDGQRIRIPAP
ncbi:MAG: efflux RND transporter periplasmic adaptor subunit [Verrucomicrobiales bacterium]